MCHSTCQLPRPFPAPLHLLSLLVLSDLRRQVLLVLVLLISQVAVGEDSEV